MINLMHQYIRSFLSDPELVKALEERQKLTPAQRLEWEPPSVTGKKDAFFFALDILLQDRPALFILGWAGIAYMLVSMAVKLLKILAH